MDRFQTRTVAEHIIRDTGNTKSDLCKIDQQIVAVQFNLRQQLLVPGLQTPDEDIRWWYSLERASGWDNPEDFPWKEAICPW